jgi:hypothetical protein
MPDPSTSGLLVLRRFLLVTASLLIAASIWFLLDDSDNLVAAERSGAYPSQSDVVAEVEGVEITGGEVETLVATELQRLEQERRRLLDGALEARIRQVLLDTAAESEGLSSQELLDREVEAKLDQVSLAEVASAARARQLDLDAPGVETTLRRELRLRAFLASLGQGADVVRYADGSAP